MKRLFFIPDCHVPFEDRRSFELTLKARQYFKPHVTVILGDFADFHSVSFHSKDPRRVQQLEDEVHDVRKRLAEVEPMGDQRHFVCGNHEERLARYTQDRAPALFGICSVEGLLDLRRLGWSYTPYRSHLRLGKLSVTHDTGNVGPYADQKSRDLFEGNVVIGHTHRMGMSYKGNAKGEAHVGMMCGWLGDVSQIDYAHRVRALQWQLGFGIGFLEDDGKVRLHACPIVGNRVEVNGKLIRG